MNVIQLMKAARYEVDGIRAANAASGLWTDEEAQYAVNQAMDRASRVLRLADSDILTASFKTTGAALSFVEESYLPSSLAIVAGTTDYTLPPDFVHVVNILPITSGFEGITFKPASANDKTWSGQRVIPTDDLSKIQDQDFQFYYTVIGKRTLRIAPEPQDSFDVELHYRYRPPILRYTSAGTVTRTATDKTITGTGTSFSLSGIRLPAEIEVGSANIISGMTLAGVYSTVTEITTDTSLETALAQTVTDGAGQSYILAMVPHLPEEHHTWLAQVAAALMYRKVNPEMSDKMLATLELELRNAVQPEINLRQVQESRIVDPYELPI